jgi:tripeptide aminopeptidase
MRLGQVDADTTANVGLISGGSALNIVPEWCSFDAEIRSHDRARLTELVQESLDTMAFAAAVSDCTLETAVDHAHAGYAFAEGDLAIRLAIAGLERAGFAATTGRSGGAADANVFNQKGLPCVNLANGMAEIHTPDEHIAVADLERMVDVTLGIVHAALAEPLSA